MTPRFRPVHVQLLLAVVTLTIAALMPPADGAILIVSLSGESPDAIAGWAVAHDARLLGRGPLPDSLVVVGNRATLASAAWRHHGLLLIGSAAGCGGKTIA